MSLPSSDSDLDSRVRSETSYEDNDDELPASQLSDIRETAKAKLSLDTGTSESDLYNTKGLQLALLAYTSLRAKAAVENIVIESYSIGDESISIANADPEDSHQIQTWVDDINIGLSDAGVGSGSHTISNTSSYIGEKTDTLP